MDDAPQHVRELQGLVPALVIMAGITSFGVYFSQYLVLLVSATVTTVAARLWADGGAAVTMVILFALFAPILAVTAKRYSSSIQQSLVARAHSQSLVRELTLTNNELEHHNATLAQQQDLIQQEEELAKHVFGQLTLGGDHELPGVRTWNQAMGSLSGDLTQTARGPHGQAYVFLGDFTGHGLPAALGALPASSVFLAMAAKGLPVESIAVELNRKLHELLPVGYFCCAVLLELSPDRHQLQVWNGGLPPILVRRRGASGYERLRSHSVPLGVLGEREFETVATSLRLDDGDVVYAYTDGLTEAENLDGEMWGLQRLETFLLRDDLPSSKLPALIDAVLEHVNLAPASDDISIVELMASADAEAVAA
jgi:serine phosphatase RsbU (regulator of sigma subunit)